MKKLFLLLVLFACGIILPQSVLAWYNGDTFTVGGIKYSVQSVTDFKVATVSCTEAAVHDGVVTVPLKVKDPLDPNLEFTVTKVSFNSGALNRNAKKLIVSEGILELSTYAFTNDYYFEELVLPSSMNKIGSFGPGVDKLTSIKFSNPNNDELSNSNDYFVFEESEKNLYSIDHKHFIFHCRPQTDPGYEGGKYEIRDEVEVIYHYLFSGDSYIKELVIGKNVETIDQEDNTSQPYYGPGILKYSLKDGDLRNPKFSVTEDGVLLSADGTILWAYPAGRRDASYTTPNGVKTVRRESFYSNHSLTTIVLKDITTMEGGCISSCSRLESIGIPASLPTISNAAISACSNFKNYFVDEDNPNYCDIDGVLFSKDKTILKHYPQGRTGEYTIPDEVVEIAVSAFAGSKVGSLTTGANLTTIGNGAFQSCSLLSEVDFSNSSNLKRIPNICFAYDNIQHVTLSTSIEEIGASAFYPGNIQTLTVPDGSNLKKIETQAFMNCRNLSAFTFEGSCKLEEIGARAFSGCTSLQSFAFPQSVTKIESSAFSECTSMSTATFADDAVISKIGNNAFADSGITTISIPNSVTEIDREAFRNCNVLTSVNIPAATTTISAEAFKYCTLLREINVDKANTEYSSVDGFLLSKDKKTLKLFPPGKANDRFTLLPPSITSIGDYSFYCCVNLKNVTIPNKVTSIGDRAFGLCDQLNTITFLCDEMIAPENIDMRYNHNAFDDGMFANITINVRKNLLDTYKNTEFYQRFNQAPKGGTKVGIKPSFRISDKNEYIAVSDQSVDLLDIKEANHTYVVPGTINDGTKDWTVSLVGDYACQNAPSTIKEIVMFENVEYIGAKAFKQTNGEQTIKNLFFCQAEPTKQLLSTTRFELTPDDLPVLPDGKKDDQYKEFDDNMKIYVRRSAYDKCQEDWAAYMSMIKYEIPFNDTHIGENLLPNAYHGSFSREFAVDLSNGGSNYLVGDNKDNAKFLAYVPMYRFVDSYGTTLIRVQSINEGGEGDGTYIPANTGVLIRKYVDDSELTSAYYEIADNQAVKDAPEMIKSITVDPGVIPASTATVWNYYIGKNDGLAHKVTKDTNIGIHKAYLAIEVPAGTKEVKFTYDEPSEGYEDVTAIENVEFNVSAPIYNIQGQRVENPTSGLYIVNGKKFYVK